MRCHLVYNVPNTGSNIIKSSRKIKAFLQHTDIPINEIGNRQNIKVDSWPKRSPISVTEHLYKGFSSSMPTLLYHLRERVRIKFTPDDIFISNLMSPFFPGAVGVTELSINQELRPKVFAPISPLHCNVEVKTKHINKNYLDAIARLIPNVDFLLIITGKYWWYQWD